MHFTDHLSVEIAKCEEPSSTAMHHRPSCRRGMETARTNDMALGRRAHHVQSYRNPSRKCIYRSRRRPRLLKRPDPRCERQSCRKNARKFEIVDTVYEVLVSDDMHLEAKSTHAPSASLQRESGVTSDTAPESGHDQATTGSSSISQG